MTKVKWIVHGGKTIKIYLGHWAGTLLDTGIVQFKCDKEVEEAGDFRRFTRTQTEFAQDRCEKDPRPLQ